jgi:hypothetical protein
MVSGRLTQCAPLRYVALYTIEAGGRSPSGAPALLAPLRADLPGGVMIKPPVLLSLLAPAAAFGQTQQRYSGDWFAFFSADRPSYGSFADLLGVGFGGERLIYKGLGIEGDVAYEFPRGFASQGIGLASLNGTYHFVNRDTPRKLVPFVTVGYAIAFRTGHANAVDYGGGVNFWFHRHFGLRAEVRGVSSRDDFNLVGLRLGLSFR